MFKADDGMRNRSLELSRRCAEKLVEFVGKLTEKTVSIQLGFPNLEAAI